MKKLLSLLTVIFCFVCVIAQTPERKVLVEEFTSSTCGPCAQLNLLLNPWLETNAEKVTVIKYQMSWPGTGDPYYTAEGGTRRSKYAVNAVPDPYLDGAAPNDNYQTYQQWMNNIAEAINTAYSQPAYIELTASFYQVCHTINATVNITPINNYPEGNNLRLFVAIVEKETYKNKKSNGETVFHHVMKKFMTPATGTVLGALTANETITQEFSWEFKGDYRLPINGQNANIINHNIEHSVEDFDNLEVVVWVQNYSTKGVENSCYAEKIEETFMFAVDYNVTNTEGGTLSATINAAPYTSGTPAEACNTVEFTATPSEGFFVKNWKLNGEIIPDNNSNNYSLLLKEDATVTVEFLKNATLVFNPTTENGELIATVEGNPITSGDTFETGTVVEFTAIPNENFEVKEWKLNNEIVPDNNTNSYSLTIENDATVTVEFVEIVGIESNNLSIVEISPNPFTHQLVIKNTQYVNTITITNSLGQIVKQESINNKPSVVISTEQFSSGLFFITLTNNEGGTLTKKIIKP